MEHETEFATYVEQTWGSLVRAAVCLGCSLGEAEDVAQTALVKAYAAWHRVRSADDRDAYVYRILVNSRHDARRRPWRRERASEQLPEVPVADAAAAVETADALHRALAGLSRAHRDVVVLRYLVQLTEAQTAAALGVPPGTVKSRLSRALAHLSTDRHLSDLAGGTHHA